MLGSRILSLYCVVVLDKHDNVVDLGIYENKGDCERALRSWSQLDDYTEWRPSSTAKVTYKRHDLRLSFYSLSDRTFQSYDMSNYAKRSTGVPPEVVAAAKKYEVQALAEPEHLRRYLVRKFRYWMGAGATVLVMTGLILLVREEVKGAPFRQFSVLLSAASFMAVFFFLQRQFASWIGAAVAAVLGWLVWLLIMAAYVIGRPFVYW